MEIVLGSRAENLHFGELERGERFLLRLEFLEHAQFQISFGRAEAKSYFFVIFAGKKGIRFDSTTFGVVAGELDEIKS